MLQEVKVGFVHVTFKPIERTRFVKRSPEFRCYSDVLHIDRHYLYFQGEKTDVQGKSKCGAKSYNKDVVEPCACLAIPKSHF